MSDARPSTSRVALLLRPSIFIGRAVRTSMLVLASRSFECDLSIVDPSYLFASMLVGTVGMAMLVFGKKAGRVVPLACGAALMLVSYVMPSAGSMLLTSGVVVAVPFFVKG